MTAFGTVANRPFVCTLLPGLLLGLSLIFPLAASGQELERLVRRLRLGHLEATLVENQLAATIDIDEQSRLRRKLARLYVDQLESQMEQPESFARISRRLKELEGEVTELRDPPIHFERLETEFRHAEYLLAQFRENRRDAELLVQASRLFTELLEGFEDLEQNCEARIKNLDLVDGGSLVNRRADEKIDELSSIGFRSAFYRGWSAFHAGMSKRDGELGRPYFRRALAAFCRFLDIDSVAAVEDWNTDYFDLGSVRNGQALLGIALTFLALEQNDQAESCLELLRDDQTAESVRNQLAFWQLQTLFELRRWQAGWELANVDLDQPERLSEIQRGQIALLLVRMAYEKPDQPRAEIGWLGLKVLAQLRQFALIGKLVEQYSINLTGNSFHAEWIRGQLAYQQAETSGAESDFQRAAGHLQAAVQMEKEIPTAELERCRYQLGWAYYRAGNYRSAAEALEKVVDRLARLEPEIAATASWLRHDCYLKLDEKDPANIRQAVAVLEQLVNRFPESELAGRARIQLVKLKRSEMGTDQTLERLRQAVAASPEDLVSRYELCLANYRKYLELVSEEQDTAAVADELRSQVRELERSSGELTAPRNLKLLLIQLDVGIREKSLDPAKLDERVSRATALAARVDDPSLLAELHFRQFLIAQSRGDRAEERRHVEWLVENGDGTVFQKSVLVRRIQQLEEDLEKLPAGEARRERVEQAIDVYRKLARATGYHVEGIATNQNVQIAVSRLAELLMESGEWEEAERNLELLIEAFPKKVVYLQRYARVLTRLRKYAEALEPWRTLSRGLAKESADWYEAKYSLILCLIETDPPQAKAPLDQFLLLYDPPNEWKAKFSELARRVGGGRNAND